MIKAWTWIPICYSVAAATSASAGVLQPIAPWVVDYREDQCLAGREYGPATAPTTLGIRPAPNGETYELLVLRSRAGPSFATESEGSVDFGTNRIRAWVLNYRGVQTKGSIYQFRISAADMTQAVAARTVTLRSERSADMTFALTAVAPLLKSLNECTADLKSYWNMDGEKDGRIRTVAKGEVRAIFAANDYPGQAIELGQEGSSRFLLLIDEKGSVAGCHVVKPSGVPVLDAMGCQVIRKRAKFQPARDANDKAVRSTVFTPDVVWRLEG